MSSTIINSIKGIKKLSYLELGVFDNENFNSIRCENKFSVDTNGSALFTGTTDEFFSQLDTIKKYDIIFIDANHDYEYVLRDFNNAVDHCDKWILIHDMFPPSVKYTKSNLCSDSYKLLHYMLDNTDFSIYVMDNNFGLTLIKMPAEKINPLPQSKNIDYNDFLTFMKNVKLYSNQEIIEILNS
jgi:hypothetical protein